VVFYKRKGYPVAQKLDVIEKNRGHFRIQRPKVSHKQVSDITQQKLCPSFIDYWADNYVGRQQRHRIGNPRYFIELWSMRERVNDGLPRTNNSVKVWHRSFQETVDCSHPTVFKLIQRFRKEQDHVEIKMERFQAGFRQPVASKSKYV